jgi:hypothetical protein
MINADILFMLISLALSHLYTKKIIYRYEKTKVKNSEGNYGLIFPSYTSRSLYSYA